MNRKRRLTVLSGVEKWTILYHSPLWSRKVDIFLLYLLNCTESLDDESSEIATLTASSNPLRGKHSKHLMVINIVSA